MIFRPWLRFVSFALALVYFSTNCAFAHKPQTTLWEERKLAYLPVDPASLSLPATVRSFSTPIKSRGPMAPLIQALPASYGSVRGVIAPASMTGQTVIHIQDVHGNAEAQRNIARTIQTLIDGKNVDLIALEGAFEPIDLSAFRSFPDQPAVRKVADYLLRSNKISGPIHAAFTSATAIPPIVGIDDRVHYGKNVAAYRKAATRVRAEKKIFRSETDRLSTLKTRTFNPALAEFDRHAAAYRRGELPMGAYVRLLSAPGRTLRQFIDALDLETKLDFARVEMERSRLLSKLVPKLNKSESDALVDATLAYRTGALTHADFYNLLQDMCEQNHVSLSGFPQMAAYLHYVVLSDGIDAEALFEDIKKAEALAYRTLTRNDQERQLIAESNALFLKGKLLDFSLTHNEWRELTKSPLPNSSFGDFYREAQIRDEKMAENLFAAMEKEKAKVAVLVTGGFHSAGIRERARNAGVTVIDFVPKISKVETENGSAYLNVFTQEKTPLEKLFEGEKLFLANTPVQPSVVATATALYVEAEDPERKADPKLTEPLFKNGDAITTEDKEPGHASGTVRHKDEASVDVGIKIHNSEVQDFTSIGERASMMFEELGRIVFIVYGGLWGALIYTVVHAALHLPDDWIESEEEPRRARFIALTFAARTFLSLLFTLPYVSFILGNNKDIFTPLVVSYVMHEMNNIWVFWFVRRFLGLPWPRMSVSGFIYGEQKGQLYRENYTDYSAYWGPAIANNRANILRGAVKVKTKKVITILGSNEGREIPFQELFAMGFEKINLVDLDEKGMRLARDRLPEELRPRVEIHPMDATGLNGAGLVSLQDTLDKIVEEGKPDEILSVSKKLGEALAAFQFSSSPDWPASLKADYVISSNLTSQLRNYTLDSLNDKVKKKYGEPLLGNPRIPNNLAPFIINLFKHHATTLDGLRADDDSVIYWSDTPAATLNEDELPEPVTFEQEMKFATALRARLLQLPWESLLFDTDIGADLVKEFQLLTDVQAAEPAKTLNALIFYFKDKNDPVLNALFLHAASTAISEKRLDSVDAVKLAYDYLLTYIEEYGASPMILNVKEWLLANDSGLEEIEGGHDYWSWITNPGAVLNQRGGGFFCESYLLRGKKRKPEPRATNEFFSHGRTRGEVYRENRKQFADFWAPAVAENQRHILEGAEQVTNKHTVTVLGANEAWEIPFEPLFQKGFQAIHLVDLDKKGMEAAKARVPEKWRDRVILHEADVTSLNGPGLNALLEQLLAIIDQSAGDADATEKKVLDFFLAFKFSDNSAWPQELKADYVISSNLSSQLSILILNTLDEKFRVKYGRNAFYTGPFLSQAQSILGKIFKHHGAALNGLRKDDDSLIYWTDTPQGLVPQSAIRGGVSPREDPAFARELRPLLMNWPWERILFNNSIGAHLLTAYELEQNVRIPDRERGLETLIFRFRHGDPALSELFYGAAFDGIGTRRVGADVALNFLDGFMKLNAQAHGLAQIVLPLDYWLTQDDSELELVKGSSHKWNWIINPISLIKTNGNGFFCESALLKKKKTGEMPAKQITGARPNATQKELSTESGVDYRNLHKTQAPYWKPALVKSHDEIIKGAHLVANKHTITILGSNEGVEIPFERLFALGFQRINLVDVDKAGMEAAVKRLPARFAEKIKIHELDATALAGPGLNALTKETDEIIATSRDAQTAIRRFIAACDAFKFKVLEKWPEELKADYVICSNMASQLDNHFYFAFNDKFEDKFGGAFLELLPKGDDPRNFRIRILKHLAVTIRALMKDEQSRAYFADTTHAPVHPALLPNQLMAEEASEKISRRIRSVTLNWPWESFLTDPRLRAFFLQTYTELTGGHVGDPDKTTRNLINRFRSGTSDVATNHLFLGTIMQMMLMKMWHPSFVDFSYALMENYYMFVGSVGLDLDPFETWLMTNDSDLESIGHNTWPWVLDAVELFSSSSQQTAFTVQSHILKPKSSRPPLNDAGLLLGFALMNPPMEAAVCLIIFLVMLNYEALFRFVKRWKKPPVEDKSPDLRMTFRDGEDVVAKLKWDPWGNHGQVWFDVANEKIRVVGIKKPIFYKGEKKWIGILFTLAKVDGVLTIVAKASGGIEDHERKFHIRKTDAFPGSRYMRQTADLILSSSRIDCWQSDDGMDLSKTALNMYKSFSNDDAYRHLEVTRGDRGSYVVKRMPSGTLRPSHAPKPYRDAYDQFDDGDSFPSFSLFGVPLIFAAQGAPLRTQLIVTGITLASYVVNLLLPKRKKKTEVENLLTRLESAIASPVASNTAPLFADVKNRLSPLTQNILAAYFDESAVDAEQPRIMDILIATSLLFIENAERIKIEELNEFERLISETKNLQDSNVSGRDLFHDKYGYLSAPLLFVLSLSPYVNSGDEERRLRELNANFFKLPKPFRDRVVKIDAVAMARHAKQGFAPRERYDVEIVIEDLDYIFNQMRETTGHAHFEWALAAGLLLAGLFPSATDETPKLLVINNYLQSPMDMLSPDEEWHALKIKLHGLMNHFAAETDEANAAFEREREAGKERTVISHPWNFLHRFLLALPAWQSEYQTLEQRLVGPQEYGNSLFSRLLLKRRVFDGELAAYTNVTPRNFLARFAGLFPEESSQEKEVRAFLKALETLEKFHLDPNGHRYKVFLRDQSDIAWAKYIYSCEFSACNIVYTALMENGVDFEIVSTHPLIGEKDAIPHFYSIVRIAGRSFILDLTAAQFELSPESREESSDLEAWRKEIGIVMLPLEKIKDINATTAEKLPFYDQERRIHAQFKPAHQRERGTSSNVRITDPINGTLLLAADLPFLMPRIRIILEKSFHELFLNGAHGFNVVFQAPPAGSASRLFRLMINRIGTWGPNAVIQKSFTNVKNAILDAEYDLQKNVVSYLLTITFGDGTRERYRTDRNGATVQLAKELNTLIGKELDRHIGEYFAAAPASSFREMTPAQLEALAALLKRVTRSYQTAALEEARRDADELAARQQTPWPMSSLAFPLTMLAAKTDIENVRKLLHKSPSQRITLIIDKEEFEPFEDLQMEQMDGRITLKPTDGLFRRGRLQRPVFDKTIRSLNLAGRTFVLPRWIVSDLADSDDAAPLYFLFKYLTLEEIISDLPDLQPRNLGFTVTVERILRVGA